MPDAVSGVVKRQIAAVHDEILSETGQVRLDLGTGRRPQRANDLAAHGRNARHAARSRPACQMKEHGLQIVVRRVRSRNPGDALPCSAARQTCIAQFACRGLHTLAGLGGIGCRVLALECERYVQFYAQAVDKIRVPLGLLSTQTVV